MRNFQFFWSFRSFRKATAIGSIVNFRTPSIFFVQSSRQFVVNFHKLVKLSFQVLYWSFFCNTWYNFFRISGHPVEFFKISVIQDFNLCSIFHKLLEFSFFGYSTNNFLGHLVYNFLQILVIKNFNLYFGYLIFINELNNSRFRNFIEIFLRTRYLIS